MKKKLIRVSTVSLSLDVLLKGQLHFLNNSYEVIAISGEDATLHKVANREGVRVIPIAMERGISPLKDCSSLWKLYRTFKIEQPAIVHSITPKAGLLTMMAAYFAGVPIRMHTFTGLIFPSKKGVLQYVLIAMDRLLCRCATHIYPEGAGVKNELQNYKITLKPLKVLADGNVNGIDVDHFNPRLYSPEFKASKRKELGIADDDFVFIFIGRLVGDKGINELVKAFVGVGNEKRQVDNQQRTISSQKLVLVGPFETDLDPLQPDTIVEIEQNPSIITVGYQDDVRLFLAVADVLVFPSYREGFPNVVLQAGAMGLPSIVTNINGCNEIVEEGKNGWIIPVKDASALQKTMQNCINNFVEVNKLKENCRTMITSRFEQKVVWEALLKEYERVGVINGK